MSDAPSAKRHLGRLVGQIALGVVLGLLILPALLELASWLGAITAFKYQGF